MTKGSLLCLACFLQQIAWASSSNAEVDLVRKLSELENAIHKLESDNAQMHVANDQMRTESLKIASENRKLQAQTAKMHEENVQIQSETVKIKAAFKSRRLMTVAETITDTKAAMDAMWLLICGMLVMLMQAGFAMVESGTCRVKNVQNILLKNLFDVCIGTLCWYAFGWTLAYGFDSTMPADEDVFAGNKQYFGHEFLESDDDGNQTPTDLPRDWFFQWAFCATAATIVSGGVAERIQFPGYFCFTICMTTFIYPIVVAWMWSTNGWLTAGKDKHLNEVGFNDFAGSGIVHMTGGIAALVGAIAVGPRMGRFDGRASIDEFNPHNLPFVVLGTFILWFGWYGFNCGSTLGLSSLSTGRLAAVVAMNTTIAASMGGLIVLFMRLAIYKKYDIGGMCNGILGGLVSITAGCGNVESGSALVIGLIGGIIFQLTSMLLKMVKVDDPIDAFAVHGACGAWGVLAACFFDWGKGFDKYNGFNGGFDNAADTSGNKDNLWKSGFAAAIVEILVIIAWVGGMSAIIFIPLRLIGILRVPDEIQLQGLDTVKHSPNKAYADTSSSDKVKEKPEEKGTKMDAI